MDINNMSMDLCIQRINELARKSKVEALSEEEKEEQKLLREKYIASVRGNLKAQLENIRIQNPDGTVEPLKKIK